MKKLLLAIALLPFTWTASAQTFSGIRLCRERATDRLSFSVKEETNIRYYLVEGSRDAQTFEVLSRISATAANSRLPRSYSATFYDTSIRYYRIRQVDMMAAPVYSAIISPKPAATTPQPGIPAGQPTAQPVIISKK